MTPDEIREGMAKLHWFHHIPLGHGIVTPGAGWPGYEKFHQAKADIYYGMGIQGQSVLDIGAFDGFFSFDAEKRGASRVVAADWWVWRHDWEGSCRLPSFQFAKKVLGSQVDCMVVDIPNLSVETMGQFDHVAFNGIVYHILDPINALIRVSKMTRRVLQVETHLACQHISEPVMLYFNGEKRTPPFTPQTGWGVNSLCMHALLKDIGFEHVLEFPTPHNEKDRSIFLAFKPGEFPEYIAKHADYAKPRFTGKEAA